jgi:sec-independent protein translocase protein TatB
MMNFGIGWSEVAIIILVGVLVIKPERLPETARFLGRIYRELSQGVYRVTHALEKEVDELKKISEPTRAITDPLKKMADEVLAPLNPTELLRPTAPSAAAPPENPSLVKEPPASPDTSPPDYPNYPAEPLDLAPESSAPLTSTLDAGAPANLTPQNPDQDQTPKNPDQAISLPTPDPIKPIDPIAPIDLDQPQAAPANPAPSDPPPAKP